MTAYRRLQWGWTTCVTLHLSLNTLPSTLTKCTRSFLNVLCENETGWLKAAYPKLKEGWCMRWGMPPGNPRGPSQDPGGNGMKGYSRQLNKRKTSPKAEVYQTLECAEPEASQPPVQNGQKGKIVNPEGITERIQAGHWAQWLLMPLPSLIIPWQLIGLSSKSQIFLTSSRLKKAKNCICQAYLLQQAWISSYSEGT